MMKSDKVALVTASGKKRIGWHVANALAERGYALAIHYYHSASDANDTVAMFAQKGVHAFAYQADLTNEQEVHSLVANVLERFGRLDVLVNCAGVWESRTLEETTASDVRRHFDANALSSFLCGQQAGLAMVKQAEGGCIVNIGDWADVRPYQNYVAYFMSKGAVHSLTRCLAVELARRNPRVRVNCILPGPVQLPPEMSAEERREVINATLAKREGSPNNIAQAVLMLVDNDYIYGACLTVDGGRTIYAPE